MLPESNIYRNKGNKLGTRNNNNNLRVNRYFDQNTTSLNHLMGLLKVEIDNFHPFPSGIIVGALVAKTVLVIWLLVAAWPLSKAKATVRIPILSALIKAE